MIVEWEERVLVSYTHSGAYTAFIHIKKRKKNSTIIALQLSFLSWSCGCSRYLHSPSFTTYSIFSAVPCKTTISGEAITSSLGKAGLAFLGSRRRDASAGKAHLTEFKFSVPIPSKCTICPILIFRVLFLFH